ncbi:tail assembly protein [Rhizobium laguerreae]|uniref:tail assembly protein n=1 Tax=Rhizobium laguerreae TaxID=1076926 RepID=UPI001C90F3FA|nr:tail assembly protein [Rhizobium laguerreae]MBY3231886.1 tail assembly protein [Rhizobium laguerreae]
MRKVILHGSLGDKYGKEFSLDVRTAGEAVRALAANFPMFMKDLREGAWHVVRGRKIDSGLALDETQISGFRLGKGDLHIAPFIAGSKRGGLLKVVLGVVLIGAAFAFTGGALATAVGAGSAFGSLGITGTQVALFGAAVALAGVSSLLSPEEKAKEEDGSQSFTMSGPANTSDQGVPVPLVYGEVITGGVLISGGIDIQQIAVTGDGGGSIGAGGGKK